MMATFLGEVKEKLKDCFMIIDSPPCQVMAETKSLAQQVDGIVFVAMANKTPRKEIEKAVNNVGREKILGVVFNGYEQARKSYYRYYDRYYTGKQPPNYRLELLPARLGHHSSAIHYDTHCSGRVVDLRIKISKSYSGPSYVEIVTGPSPVHAKGSIGSLNLCHFHGGDMLLLVINAFTESNACGS